MHLLSADCCRKLFPLSIPKGINQEETDLGSEQTNDCPCDTRLVCLPGSNGGGIQGDIGGMRCYPILLVDHCIYVNPMLSSKSWNEFPPHHLNLSLSVHRYWTSILIFKPVWSDYAIAHYGTPHCNLSLRSGLDTCS